MTHFVFVRRDASTQVLNLDEETSQKVYDASIISVDGVYFTYSGIRKGGYTFEEVNPPLELKSGDMQ